MARTDWGYLVEDAQIHCPHNQNMPVRMRDWERRAPDRIKDALIRTLPDGLQRYHNDVGFHAAVDAFSYIAAMAVFEEPTVTDEEKVERMKAFSLIVDSMGHTGG